MRPASLDPLFAPATTLPGVGPKLEKLLEKIAMRPDPDEPLRIGDLLFTLPHSVIDRRVRSTIADAMPGTAVTLTLFVDRHDPPPPGNRRVPYRVHASDESGTIALTFFRPRGDWLQKQLPEGGTVIASGKLDWFNGRASMVHPEAIVHSEDELVAIEPVYPGTAGLSPRLTIRSIGHALERLPQLAEWQDGAFLRQENFSAFGEAMRSLHQPGDAAILGPESPARRRLAYDELLAGQLAIALVRSRMKRKQGRSYRGDGQLRARLVESLPFSLTDSQKEALSEIEADMTKPERMLRLLQGDVGAGKTVVALLAMAQALEAGTQALMMAPTEILARQHHRTIAQLAAPLGEDVAILTGRSSAQERRRVLAGLEDGSIRIVVGTHALFQEKVAFRDLGLAVVDEQHRFGVHQRLALGAKGQAPDILVMTATPIPRTLVLTAFGDMDVSKLTGKPAGRKPIQTTLLDRDRMGDLLSRVRAALDKGEKIYWICPLVEESEVSELMSAEQRYEMLCGQLGGERIGLVHGRLSGEQKEAAMAAFKDGRSRLLVATTVIEVGVDVPDASIMIIEHAERFGLAQLHQLRGRVGRGDRASSCVLLYQGPLGEVAKARLETMRASEDGFLIAEQDLKLRGEGDILGTRQSGLPGFRLADLSVHGDLLRIARDDARLIVETDPDLQTERGTALRQLLYLFRQDQAIRLLRAG